MTHFRHGVLRVFRVAGEVQFAGGTGARTGPSHLRHRGVEGLLAPV